MRKTIGIYLRVVSFCLLASPAFATKPNPQLTPGELCTPSDVDFAGYRYPSQMAYCKRDVSYAEKVQVAKSYGVPESEWDNYEFDHLIPLNAGGTSHPDNLWPQPLDEAHEKDKVELETYKGLRDGTLTQAQAVQMIRDWIDAH